MRPLTNYLHKAMIPFYGLPFLAYSFLALPPKCTVVIVVNHLSTQLTSYFGAEYNGRRIQYLKQVAPKGTGDALVQFSKAYNPRSPVVVWQADQLIVPDDVNLMCHSKPNSVLYSETSDGLREIGLWKLKPGTLRTLRSHFERGEYKALPIIERDGANQIITKGRKIELSFDNWKNVEEACKKFRQKFLIESR